MYNFYNLSNQTRAQYPAGADWLLNLAFNFGICISLDHYHQLKIKVSVRRCFLLVTVILVGGQERRL